jgi:hypothetical protein
MASRKALKNVAYGLLGTFVSRDNDIDGYWGLGVLRLFADRHDMSTVTIDMLNKSLSLSNDSPVRIAEETYQEWFRNALKKSGIDIGHITLANITLRFSTFEEFPNVIRDTRGKPYFCKVAIIHDDGTSYSASKVGCCAPHDPNKDYRSTRAK